MIDRRRLLGCAAATVLTLPLASRGRALAAGAEASSLKAAFAAIEKQSRGRLGVAVIDTRSGLTVSHRGDQRFAMCNTFKALLAAAVLDRVDRNEERLDRAIVMPKDGFLPHSPVSEPNAGRALSVAELCQAVVTTSDNTAANLLLKSIGGPAAITGFVRRLGDPVTRLDRYELALNDVEPGDPRDTTTPLAMAKTLQTLLLGDALAAGSRKRLTAWLVGNKTGDKRLRAGLPRNWKVGDKTGTGSDGKTNDIGIAWPPDGKPILITAFVSESDASLAKREAAIAAVAREVAEALR